MKERLLNKKTKLSVIGLGYVGMPIAVAFSKYVNVVGFDVNEDKILQYKNGIDPTNEVGNEKIEQCKVEFTSDEKRLRDAHFHIVAVPTPVNQDKTPNLYPVESASKIIGRNLTKGSYVVYESTVYPGVTEDICVKILEKESGLKCGIDFKVGYSPERINPGDKIHRLENIKKIVSGMDGESLNTIADVYELVIEAGVHKASSIKVAEAAKVVENSQRDINIAFMNELAMVFDKMNISTYEVVEAMNTKWNALGFYPGLVGGHCIGVDPYYFIYQAEKLGYHSQIIASGRKINDGMGSFIADVVVRELVKKGYSPKKAKIAILGLTFKENCPDLRNSKVEDVINRLEEYEIKPQIVDGWANKDEAKKEYGVSLTTIDKLKDIDCLIVAVAHNEIKKLTVEKIKELTGEVNNKLIIDIKSCLDKTSLEKAGYFYWSL